MRRAEYEYGVAVNVDCYRGFAVSMRCFVFTEILRNRMEAGIAPCLVVLQCS